LEITAATIEVRQINPREAHREAKQEINLFSNTFFGHRNTSHQSSLAFTLTLTRDLGALFPLSIMENGIGLRMEEHLRQGKTAIMTQ